MTFYEQKQNMNMVIKDGRNFWEQFYVELQVGMSLQFWIVVGSRPEPAKSSADVLSIFIRHYYII